MTSKQTGIPPFIFISIIQNTFTMTTVDEDDVTEVSNMRVSVASVASKQTQSTNKSVIGLDSPEGTPGSKAKRARTKSSFYTPEESNVETLSKAKASSPARSAKRNLAEVMDDNDVQECDMYVSNLERKYREARVTMKAEPGNSKLVLLAQDAEREFFQTLFVLNKRTGNGIKWPGWTEGYIQLATLSKLGQKYQATRSKYIVLMLLYKS
jgi:hypothetical protein